MQERRRGSNPAIPVVAIGVLLHTLQHTKQLSLWPQPPQGQWAVNILWSVSPRPAAPTLEPAHTRGRELECTQSTCTRTCPCICTAPVPYSGIFRGIFVRSEFLASLWKMFRGCGILNHTPEHCGTVSWVKISWFASQP